jgi:hypothetical protein
MSSLADFLFAQVSFSVDAPTQWLGRRSRYWRVASIWLFLAKISE